MLPTCAMLWPDEGSYGDEPGLVGRCKMCPAGIMHIGWSSVVPALSARKVRTKTGLTECHGCDQGKMNAAPSDSMCG